MCAAHLQDMDAATEHFRALLAVDAADFADLYMDVGNVLSEQRHFDEVGSLRLASHTLLARRDFTLESHAWHSIGASRRQRLV